jgi:nitrite reductase/ring-hydroxylating ferredoxin subunit
MTESPTLCATSAAMCAKNGTCIVGDDVALAVYPVKVEGGDIFVNFEEPVLIPDHA